MVLTPNKGYTLLEDGLETNPLTLATDLQLLDATLNLILEDVYEGSATPTTPTNLQPGQAWFISDDSTLSGLWADTFGAAAGSRGGDIIAIWANDPNIDPLTPESFIWLSAPVPTTAYGYIVSRQGRYQFNPVTELWEEQTKLQECNWVKPFPSGLPITAGADLKYLVMVAPFDMRITDISYSTRTEPLSTNTALYSPEGVLPRIAYSSTASDAFGTWTELAKAGVHGSVLGPGNWGPSGSVNAAFSAIRSITGSISPDQADTNTDDPAWFTEVIPEGAAIGVGGPWTSGTNTATVDATLVRSWQLKITYVQI